MSYPEDPTHSDAEPGDEPFQVPIDGCLDLHAFAPGDVRDLVPEYLGACQQQGILEVRIVHGKGTGSLRQGVHALLERLPAVEGFRWPAGDGAGGWGATLVRLKPVSGPG